MKLAETSVPSFSPKKTAPGSMDAKHEVRPIQTTELEIDPSRISGKIKRNVGKISLDMIFNMHVLVFLTHAIFTAYLALPGPINVALESSPFLALAFSFMFAKKMYHKFDTRSKRILPSFKSVESKIKSGRLLLTPKVVDRAILAVIMFMVSVMCVHITITIPMEYWPMKIWLTILWITEDFHMFLTELYYSETDIVRKRRLAIAMSVALSIFSTQGCYIIVMMYLSLKWTIACLALTFIISFPLWLHLYTRDIF